MCSPARFQAPFGAFPPPTYDFSAVGIGHKVYVFGVSCSPLLLVCAWPTAFRGLRLLRALHS